MPSLLGNSIQHGQFPADSGRCQDDAFHPQKFPFRRRNFDVWSVKVLKLAFSQWQNRYIQIYVL